MAMEPVGPDTHPSWLQRHMQGFCHEMHQAAEGAVRDTVFNRFLLVHRAFLRLATFD